MEEKKEKSTGGVLPAEFRAEDFMCSDRVSWSWHEEMECGVVVEGTLSYLYENEIVRLSAGDGFFMNTMTRHGIINRTKDYCLVYMIKFHPRLVGGSDRHRPQPTSTRLLLHCHQDVQPSPLRGRLAWQGTARCQCEDVSRLIQTSADGLF